MSFSNPLSMSKVFLKKSRCFFKIFLRYGGREFSTRKSYYHCPGQESLSPLTLGELVETSSRRYGGRTALISCHQNQRISFDELLDEGDRFAAGLAKLGFQKGDKIGIWAPNRAEWYVSYVGCARGGFVAVTMNPYYQPMEMELTIKKSGMKGLICGDVFRKINFHEILSTVCPDIQYCKPGKFYSDKLPTLRHIIIMAETSKSGTYKYSDILNMADDDSISKIRKNQGSVNFDDPCNIQFTSGTTGNPKAAIHSHFNLVNNGYYCGKRVGLDKKHHIICLQNPLFHVFGTTVAISAAINHGSTIVMPNDGYDPDKNLTAIAKEQCTAIFGTPTMFVDLIAKQRSRKENINSELAVTGGSLCPPKLFRDMLDVLGLKKVKTVYGLTETTASIFFTDKDDTEQQVFNTVGRVQEHCEVKVVDDKGHLVPFGVPGELLVRGYCVMKGYFEEEEKTKETIDANGWCRTGDKFILHENGYGEIVGRIKDMITRGGENIYPKEIEDFLMNHPDILVVQVIGVPHERLGEEVCAVIKTRDNKQITTEELLYFCKGKMANFKIPSTIRIVDIFPTTTSGKIKKHQLVEMFINNKKTN